jgi:hypothetical protein
MRYDFENARYWRQVAETMRRQAVENGETRLACILAARLADGLAEDLEREAATPGPDEESA